MNLKQLLKRIASYRRNVRRTITHDLLRGFLY